MTGLGCRLIASLCFYRFLFHCRRCFLVAIGIRFSLFLISPGSLRCLWIRIFCGDKKMPSRRTLRRDFSFSTSPKTRLDASLNQISLYLLLATPCYSLRPLHRPARNERAASQNHQNWSAALEATFEIDLELREATEEQSVVIPSLCATKGAEWKLFWYVRDKKLWAGISWEGTAQVR